MSSVLQEWVTELPLRAQGTLLTGVRGCDTAPKTAGTIDERYGCSTGECSPERHLAAFLRYCILVPADPREVDIPGAWFQSSPPAEWRPSAFGHYPLHWYSHLMHCFQVVSYYHPGIEAVRAREVYERLVHGLHLNPETDKQLVERLTEDRIANDTVVS